MITKSDLKLFKNYRQLEYLGRTYKTFIAFDTETSGTNCTQDRIIEIGAYKTSLDINSPYYKNPQVFDILINPQIQISPFIENLTKITNEMLKNASSENEAIKKFLEFIGKDSLLIAHNAPFDLYFLDNELERLYLPPLKNTVVDTLPLSRWAFPDFAEKKERGVYTLQNLAKKLEIQVEAAHRAYDDAKVCMEIFKKIYFSRVEPLPGQWELTFETP